MNKGIFFTEGLKFIDIKLKEKLNEYEAPPLSPSIDKLSAIKKSITPFCDKFENCAEIDCLNTCKLEFRSLETTEESTLELTTEETENNSLPVTPKVRKPMSVIMSSIRRINFDLSEDYELQVKSTNVENHGSDIFNETVV